jgi:N-acetylmuramoyl-L-alanine amidase
MNRLVVAVLLSLAWPGYAAAGKFRTVVIDPGHGGHDRGGIPGQKTAEKEVALATAKRVESALKAAGFRTIMTRKTDTFVTLDGRVAIANAHKDALFLSIHYNSAQREGAEGIETYYGGEASAAIARRIHQSLVAGTGAFDRGVRKAKYYVLRRSRVPAVLVECGFLTNKDEAKRARSADYQEKLAKQITAALR